MSPESETAATLRPPGPPSEVSQTRPLHTCSSSVCPSTVFCKAQMENAEDSVFSPSCDVFQQLSVLVIANKPGLAF